MPKWPPFRLQLCNPYYNHTNINANSNLSCHHIIDKPSSSLALSLLACYCYCKLKLGVPILEFFVVFVTLVNCVYLLVKIHINQAILPHPHELPVFLLHSCLLPALPAWTLMTMTTSTTSFIIPRLSTNHNSTLSAANFLPCSTVGHYYY